MTSLNSGQTRAAEAAGSVAVTAGAGTGKTRMLAYRYLHLVRAGTLSPLAVVAVTFTEKAAAELRARIRETLQTELRDDTITAEVEAAQISTFHALAARICRDFYDLADIPANFSVLDETEAPIWAAEKFNEAYQKLDASIVQEFEGNWLICALQDLLKDPMASEKALALGAEHWRASVEEARADAAAKLLGSDAWREANSFLCECSGVAGDTLEAIRADLHAAMRSAGPDAGIDQVLAVMKRFRKNLGSARNWNASDLSRLRTCIVALRERTSELGELATMMYGPGDDEAARRLRPLAAAFHTVRDHLAKAKLEEKVLDFNDLERYAVEILDHDEAVAHYKDRWRAFLIDEFQDTNATQAQILRRLSAGTSLTIVGDEKQSIYGFRGADVTVFGATRAEIIETYGGFEVPLNATFRSHEQLTSKANELFAPVLGELHQPLVAQRAETNYDEPYISVAAVEDVKASDQQKQVLEAQYIADQIDALHIKGVPFGDMAIISRRWAPLNTYLDVLSARGIPAVNAGGGSLLKTREAKDVFSLLRFLADQNDDIALVAVLRSPFFAYSDKVLFYASRDKTPENTWWDVIQARPEFERAVEILNTLIDSSRIYSSEQVIRLASSRTGYDSVIANLPQGDRRTADLNGVFEIFRKLDSKGTGEVFATARYLNELYETETEIPRPQLEAGDAVILMTIHKAKGLEWPVVFVPDLSTGFSGFGSRILIDSELGVAFQPDGDEFQKNLPAIHKLIKQRRDRREAEEARRLLYVAITRAKEKVILTACKISGCDMDTLRPGIDAAGIPELIIPFNEGRAILPAPGERDLPALMDTRYVLPVHIGLKELPVTALTTYYRCPLAFKYRYVDNHPGVVENRSTARRDIGILTHLALELGIRDAATLSLHVGEQDKQNLVEAARLAERFRTHASFAPVRSSGSQNEVPITLSLDGLELSGYADLVGDDFVVDFKTDAVVDQDLYRFQIWAYAQALRKSRAYLAYLRHDLLIGYAPMDLLLTGQEASELARGIRSAIYIAKPSPENCGRCEYNSICPVAAAGSGLSEQAVA